jgi:hypothetical protein
MSEQITPFIIYRGSATKLQFELLGPNDQQEDLTGAVSASAAIVDYIGGVPLIQKACTITGNILELSLTDVETQALPEGTLLTDAAVIIGPDRFVTDPIQIIVQGSVTA